MNRDDIEKLLGGYATGTLTPEEREALFAAALEDQQLFEALAREEPLRELLQDPIAKSRLRAALEQTPEPWHRRWLRPAVWAIPAVGLAAIVVVLIVQRPPARQPVTIAQVVRPSTEPAVPVPSPLPQVLEDRPLPPQARRVEPRPAEPLVAAATPPPSPPAPVPPAPSVAQGGQQGQAGIAVAPRESPLVAPAPQPRPVLASPPPPASQKDVQVEAAAPLAAAESVTVTPAPAPSDLPVRARRSAESIRLQTAAGQLSGVAGFVPALDARALYYGTAASPVFQTNLVQSELKKQRAAPPVAPAVANAPGPTGFQHLGLRYSVLRRTNGQVASVNPNEPIDRGGELSLRIEPNEAGYVYIFERTPDGWQLFSTSRVERMAPYNVPPTGTLQFDRPGPKELFVVFSRQPQQTPYPVPEQRLDQLLSGSLPEGVTYVVSTGTIVPAQILAFPITLTQK